MPGVYIGTSPLKAAYVGTTPVKEIYVGTTKVRPVVKALCFTANTAGSTIRIQLTGSPTSVTLETSTDGDSWSTYTYQTITLANVGDKVYFRNASDTDTRFSKNSSNYYYFTMTGSIAGSGDVTYLLNKNGTDTLTYYCFYYLFKNCAALTSAPDLPATTLRSHCYHNMFASCTSLVKAPSLPATTLKESCYDEMFINCTSLVYAPELPAETIAYRCYAEMFYGCTELSTLPRLIATGTLPNYSYYYMFYNCSKIKISTTQTGEYQTEYRIPTAGTGTGGTPSSMFQRTGGTFTGTPTLNTTYYTSNTLV